MRLEEDADLTALIQKAKDAHIFGELAGMAALSLRHAADEVQISLRGKPDALSCTQMVLLRNEDVRLARTLLLIGANIELRGATVDEVIALIKSASADSGLVDNTSDPALRVFFGADVKQTLGEVLAMFRASLLQLSKKPLVEIPGKRWCCELRRVGGYETAAEVLEQASRPLYGLLHADEGWGFVPAAHAATEVGRFWGSRDYVAVLAQPAAVVVLNLTERRDDDRNKARALTRKLAGVNMPHLELTETAVAGVEHGALFALQRSLLRLLAARELESRLFGVSKAMASSEGPMRALLRWSRSLPRRFPALLRVLYRAPQSRLYRDLLQVSRGGVSELDDLQVFMDERLGTTPLMEQLRYAAELVDIELRDKRMMRLNWLVVLLTVLTVAIGVIELVWR